MLPLVYGLCAAFLIAYLVGYPASVLLGTRFRRLRLFALGGLAAGLVLFVVADSLFLAIAGSLVGAGLAVGFAEIAFSGPLMVAHALSEGRARVTARTKSAQRTKLARPSTTKEPIPSVVDFENQPTNRPPPLNTRARREPGAMLGPLDGGTMHGLPPKSLLGPLAAPGGSACQRCGTRHGKNDLRCRECDAPL